MGSPLGPTIANSFLLHYEMHLWLPEVSIVSNLNMMYIEDKLTK